MKLLHKFKKLDRFAQYSIIVIIIGILIRFSLALLYTPSGDACWHGSVARYIGTTGDIPDFEHLGRGGFARSPLFHLFGGGLYAFFASLGFSHPEVALQLINPLLGAFTLLFTYKIARMLLDKKAAFFAVVFITFIPLQLFYSYTMYLDATITFFITAAVYFLLKQQYVIASIIGGLAALTNINYLAALPLFLLILYTRHRGHFKRFLTISLLFFGGIFLISLPWYIRNWILFDNPIWPWLDFIFGGVNISYDVLPISSFDPSSISLLNTLTSFYLGLFGVPDGNIGVLTFFDLPFFSILISIWIGATILFMCPFFCTEGKYMKKKSGLIIFSWVGFYVVYMIVTSTILSGTTFVRYASPALPAAALLWGVGCVQLLRCFDQKIIRQSITIILLLICAGFVVGEGVKTVLASNEWDTYSDDFNWIKYNTPQNSIFMANGQCFSYHFDRQTLSPPTQNGIEIINQQGVDYVWVNQEFTLHHGRYTQNELDYISQFPVMYDNEQTGTKVYKVE